MFTIFTKIVKFFLDLFDLTILVIVAILCKKDLKDFFEWLMEFKLGLKEYKRIINNEKNA